MLNQCERCPMKKVFIILIIIFSMLLYLRFTSYRFSLPSGFLKYKVFKFMSDDTKFVLFWTPYRDNWGYMNGYGYEPFKNCNYSNCFITSNRSMLPLEQFDALIIHADYNKKKHGSPWIRSPHQRYIFSIFEAPANTCPDLKQYRSYFNWTMSYRFDSDIILRFGYIIKQKTNYSFPSAAVLKNKSNLAAWMVSNCRTTGKREELVKEIQKFTKIDVYGKCGNLKCARIEGNKNNPSPECYSMVEKKYKFYFSFENSYCKEYATEKLYNILQKNIVPVVYGFNDYKLSSPPNSVINVEDFDSAKDLVSYLKYLETNEDEYLKYLEWKKYYTVKSLEDQSACKICEKLHEPLKESIYHDLHTWWWGERKSNCKQGKSLPKIVINSFQ